MLPRVSRKLTVRRPDFAVKRTGNPNAKSLTAAVNHSSWDGRTNGGGVLVVGLRYVPPILATFEAQVV
jgi:hypothetical protein